MLLYLMNRRALGLLAVLTVAWILPGCQAWNNRSCSSGHARHHEYLGVQDEICHGYQPTVWRYWNNAACGPHGCPTHSDIIELPPASAVPEEHFGTTAP